MITKNKAAGFPRAASNINFKSNTNDSPIDLLLGKLEKVTERGSGQYSALCPSHDDASPSLSIRETEDRILLHCFSGCYPGEVLAAVGLSLADLFNTPFASNTAKPLSVRQRWNGVALLRTVAHECLVVVLAAEDIARGHVLNHDDTERVIKAGTRIRAAAELVQ